MLLQTANPPTKLGTTRGTIVKIDHIFLPGRLVLTVSQARGTAIIIVVVVTATAKPSVFSNTLKVRSRNNNEKKSSAPQTRTNK